MSDTASTFVAYANYGGEGCTEPLCVGDLPTVLHYAMKDRATTYVVIEEWCAGKMVRRFGEDVAE